MPLEGAVRAGHVITIETNTILHVKTSISFISLVFHILQYTAKQQAKDSDGKLTILLIKQCCQLRTTRANLDGAGVEYLNQGPLGFKSSS